MWHLQKRNLSHQGKSWPPRRGRPKGKVRKREAEATKRQAKAKGTWALCWGTQLRNAKMIIRQKGEMQQEAQKSLNRTIRHSSGPEETPPGLKVSCCLPKFKVLGVILSLLFVIHLGVASPPMTRGHSEKKLKLKLKNKTSNANNSNIATTPPRMRHSNTSSEIKKEKSEGGGA